MGYGRAEEPWLARREPLLEAIELRTRDGQTLFADVREARGRGPKGIAVLAHAMFARRTEFERPEGRGLADLFADEGYVTITFDFRGHGESGPSASQGGDWSYDDLVKHDLPTVAACAKERYPGVPLLVVGHSLGGHVALAAQGLGWLEADALVLIAANVWMRTLEPSRRTWMKKRLIAESLLLVARRRGYLPVRALGLGSDDEGLRYIAALRRCAREGRWRSDDGRWDYGAAVAHVDVPLAVLSSTADTFRCAPSSAEKMVARARGPRFFRRIDRADDGSSAPGHMEVVTSGASREVYRETLRWIEGRLALAR